MPTSHSKACFRLIAALTLLAALSSGCATARLASGWAPGTVTANGSAEEWADKQVCSVMKDGLQLSVANDAERLYVLAKFRANDPNWSRATSMGGLTLRVTGPHRRTMSFRLPKGPERSGSQGFGGPPDTVSGGSRMQPPPDQMRAGFEDKLVVTDVDKNVVPVPADGSQGPAAGFSGESGICVYEFSIPLQDTSFAHYSLGAGAGTGLNLTVAAGPSAEMRRAMQGQMQAQGPPAGTGFGGGRPRGGFGEGRGRGGPPSGQASTNPSLSVAVRLAAAP
jgi:hypothetical protein